MSSATIPSATARRVRSRGRRLVEDLLEIAGIHLDGPAPWDPQVRDERLFGRILRDGSLGLGEAYVEGWWECESLDGLFFRLCRADLADNVPIWRGLFEAVRARVGNAGRPARAVRVAPWHYDLGNDLFEAMLDRRMTYSCAYWPSVSDLDSAQEAKLDLVCRKLGLEPGMRVLDIGSGWGSFAVFAAERYGVRVVGVTLSREQLQLARERAGGLPIEFRLQDYRDLDEPFDAIASIGMFEHVGAKNFKAFFDVVSRCLRPDGLFLLHTIGSAPVHAGMNPWMERYIFPDAHVPSDVGLARALDGRFIVEDWHNFGADYDRTALAWESNFRSHWGTLEGRYGERFYRMWRYYLLSCAGSFRARHNQLWQLVLSKQGVTGGYVSVR